MPILSTFNILVDSQHDSSNMTGIMMESANGTEMDEIHTHSIHDLMRSAPLPSKRSCAAKNKRGRAAADTKRGGIKGKMILPPLPAQAHPKPFSMLIALLRLRACWLRARHDIRALSPVKLTCDAEMAEAQDGGGTNACAEAVAATAQIGENSPPCISLRWC